jgi:hypothetical protein
MNEDRILFVTSSHEDYLADGLLHGLRSILGSNIVDFPKAEHLYSGFAHRTNGALRGHGMTVYTCPLPDTEVDRSQIEIKLENGFFKWIIFSAIERQFGLFLQWRRFLSPGNTVIVDGADTDLALPYRNSSFSPYFFQIRNILSSFIYFKREWTPRTAFGLFASLAGRFGCKGIKASKNLRQISFCVPASKIMANSPVKTKLFPSHIVDPELRLELGIGGENYTFSTEADYYADLSSAKFGITLKRGGWDCLRHYEIVLNHAVPCFRTLGDKPETCAPHGLNSKNCITYNSVDHLLHKCGSLSPEDYFSLQQEGQKWIKEQTTSFRAAQFLRTLSQIDSLYHVPCDTIG